MRHFKDPWELMDLPYPYLCLIWAMRLGQREIEARFPELKLPMFAGKWELT